MSLYVWQSAVACSFTFSLIAICGCENAAPPVSTASPASKAVPAGSFASPSSAEQASQVDQSAEGSPGESEPVGEAKQADAPKAPANIQLADIQLDIASWEETQAIIAEHKGKVVVIDLWSTFCVPCVKEFPNLVAIHEKYGDDVVCLSLNCNYSGLDPHDKEKVAVLEFLTAQKATFRNLMNREEDTDLYKKVGIASIPVVQVYGRDGKLAKQFDNEKDEYGKNGFTYAEHIVPFVESLVKAEKAE